MDFSIAIDPSFRKASIEWLEKKDPEYKGLEARNEDEYVPRLGRHGPGATPSHVNPLSSSVDRRIAGAIRKQQQNGRDADMEEAASEDEQESRNKAAAPRRSSKAGSTPQRAKEGTSKKQTTPQSAKKPETPKKVIEQQPIQIVDDSDDDFEKKYVYANPPVHGKWNGQNGSGPRKKKKIRSRQKNLKKDNRAKDQLPAHLTEETLKGGRVYKEELQATGERPAGEGVPEKEQS